MLCPVSGTMTGGGGRVMRGRIGSSIGTEVTQQEVGDLLETLLELSLASNHCYGSL
jgi:hypothetical protein